MENGLYSSLRGGGKAKNLVSSNSVRKCHADSRYKAQLPFFRLKFGSLNLYLNDQTI